MNDHLTPPCESSRASPPDAGAIALLDEMKDASAIASHGDARESGAWRRYDKADRELRDLLGAPWSGLPQQDRNILAVALLRFEQGTGHANDIRRAKELRAQLAGENA